VENPLKDGVPGIALFACPIKPPLKCLFGHQLWLENDGGPIILPPILMQEPALCLHPLKQSGSGQRGENEESGEFNSIPFAESEGPFKDPFIIMIQPKNKPGQNHDVVVVKGFHGLLKLGNSIEGFIHFLQVFRRERLYPDEQRDASTLRSEFQKLRIPGQGHAGLAGPFLFEGLQLCEKFFGVMAVSGDVIVDEYNELSV
jgi:hypothetical protein